MIKMNKINLKGVTPEAVTNVFILLVALQAAVLLVSKSNVV